MRTAGMTEDDFRDIALGFDGAIEASHMRHPDFRANGRIFASLHPDGRQGMVKLTPEQQRVLLEKAPAAFTPANGAWGRAGCTMVDLAAADRAAVVAAITDAWQNVQVLGKARAKKAPAKPSRTAKKRS